MKTTVELPDGLIADLKRAAAEDRTTMRDLVEQALRALLEQRRGHGEFRLRHASVGGRGLQPAFRDAGWEAVREASYEGRGG